MSTLSITKGTIPKGRYTILIQCSSFESAKEHEEFCKGGLTIYKDNIQKPEEPDSDFEDEEEEVEVKEVQRKAKDECQEPSDFVKEKIEAGEPFTDAEFPPEQKSLSLKGNYENLTWKRASEIFENPAIFKEGIEAGDVNQGELGDCYFLCAMSAIAEYPDRVKALFRT